MERFFGFGKMKLSFRSCPEVWMQIFNREKLNIYGSNPQSYIGSVVLLRNGRDGGFIDFGFLHTFHHLESHSYDHHTVEIVINNHINTLKLKNFVVYHNVQSK